VVIGTINAITGGSVPMLTMRKGAMDTFYHAILAASYFVAGGACTGLVINKTVKVEVSPPEQSPAGQSETPVQCEPR
jgi:hypothetical protein